MATVTKPMALDESIHTTDGNDTNIADLMQSGLASIATAIGAIPALDAANITYDNSTSGLAATDVKDALDELASEKANASDVYTKAQTDAKIEALDYSDTAVSGSYVTEVDETDGVIAVTREAADATPTENSQKLVTSGGVYTEISALNDNLTQLSEDTDTTTATGDSFALTPTSEGNILAHTIYGMSEQDGTPTPSSPVDIVSSVANYECVGKNLIPYPYYNTTKTTNGITFTDNGDGTVTVSGTSSANNANFYCTGAQYSSTIALPDGTYKVSFSPTSSLIRIVVSQFSSDGTFTNLLSLYGGEEGTFTASGDYHYSFILQVPTNGSAFTTPITFYPMLRLASVTDATYEPYRSHTADTDLTLRAIEVTSSDDYNLVRDGKYYIADSVDWSEDDGYVLTRRIGNIASYSSETLTTKWMSSMDEYAEGTTPSSTANVIYVLATPTTTSLTADQAEALLSLKTYDTATSINCTADVSPTMEIEYAKERVPALALTGHNVAKSNELAIAELNSAVIALGGE